MTSTFMDVFDPYLPLRLKTTGYQRVIYLAGTSSVNHTPLSDK